MIIRQPRHPNHLSQDPDSISLTFLEQFVLVHFILLEVLVWKQSNITEPNCSWGFCSQHLYGSGWCAPVNLGCSCMFSNNVGKCPVDFGCACSTHVSSGRPWIWRSFHIQHKHKSVEPDFHLRLSTLWCKNPDQQVDDPHSLLQECQL